MRARPRPLGLTRQRPNDTPTLTCQPDRFRVNGGPWVPMAETDPCQCPLLV